MIKFIFTMIQKTLIKDWLNIKFITWEEEQGGRRTLKAFAEYLNVDDDLLRKWMRGIFHQGTIM